MQEMVEMKKFDFLGLQDFANPVNYNDLENEKLLSEITGSIAEGVAANGSETKEKLPPAPPQVFSEQDMAQAKTASFEEGKLKGIQEIKEQMANEKMVINTALVSKLENILAETSKMNEEYKESLKLYADDTTALSIHIAKIVAGEAIDKSPELMVEQAIEQCLPLLIKEPNITLTANPAVAAIITKKIDEIAEDKGYKGTIIIEENADLSPEDCNIKWLDGQADKNITDIWEKIENLISNNQ